MIMFGGAVTKSWDINDMMIENLFTETSQRAPFSIVSREM